MRYSEFKIPLIESKEDNEAKELLSQTDDGNVLRKAVNFLKSKLAKIKPDVTKEPNTLSNVDDISPTETPVKEDINADKAFAIQAIEELAKAGATEDIQQLISFLRKSEIYEHTKRAINNNISQGVKGDLDKKLGQMIIDLNASFDEKAAFLDMLATQKGMWDGKELISNLSGNIYTKLSKNPIANELAKPIALKLRGAMGYGPDQGPGEFLLALTGKGIDLADKSDLVLINGMGVEVKADGTSVNPETNKSSRSGGRLYATSGYNGGTGARPKVKEALLKAGVPNDAFDNFGWNGKEKGKKYPSLNFNASGFKNLNKLLAEYTKDGAAKQVLQAIAGGFYTDLPAGLENDFVENSSKGNQIDFKTAIIEFVALGHEYYKLLEGHDYIMIFNTDNGDYVMIKDGNDMKQALKQGSVKVNGGMDYFDDRSKGTPQLLTGNI